MMGRQCAYMYMLMASIFVFFTLASASVESFSDVPPSTTLSLQDKLELLMNDLKVLPDMPDYSIYNEGATNKPEDDPWYMPNWSPETVAPWLDTGGSYAGQYNPYDTGPKVDVHLDIPTLKPVLIDFDNTNVHNNIWDDGSSRFGNYTWITMAVVLVVFFKVTVIAVMVARRMRRGQHRVIIRSSNSSSVTVPSEFTSDQAHLVTPANIVYVDTDGVMPPRIPQLFTPPPYCESLLPSSETGPANPNEEPPPYSS